jgi:hypothetical protein
VLVHRGVEIGRRARQFDRLFVIALRMRQDAGGGKPLDFDLLCPVIVLVLVAPIPAGSV